MQELVIALAVPGVCGLVVVGLGVYTAARIVRHILRGQR